MQRLVIWGFTLALIPLLLALVWEAVVACRGFFAPGPREEPLAGARTFGNDRPQRGAQLPAAPPHSSGALSTRDANAMV